MTALKIAHEPEQPSAEIYTVSPSVAKRWLSRNARNRKVRDGVVAAYARDMAAGHWKLTGEAIKFDTSNALADGQHRLHAIVSCGVSVPMMVVRGVEPESQSVMDSGIKRSIIDTLSLEGRKNPAVLAAAARLALTETGCGFVAEGRSSATRSEIAEFIEDQGSSLERAAQLAQHYYPAIDMPPSVLCVAWMRFANISGPAAGEFFSTVADCQTNGVGDPRLALIRRLASIRKDNERVTQSAYLSLIFRAWNAWRNGSRLILLPMRIGKDLVRIPGRLK